MQYYLLRTPEVSPAKAGKTDKDPPLSTDEMRLARTISRKFTKNPFGIQAIFCGPSLQAIQTADLIHDVLNVRLRVLSGFSSQAAEAQIREALLAAAFPTPSLIISPERVGLALLRAIGIEQNKIEQGVIYQIEQAAPDAWKITEASKRF
jgi:phosphohistidine phosphatase SixA